MLLLHLSDIHFNKRYGGSAFDPHFSIRSEILRDAARLCEVLGPVSAILVSGDIAFSGHADEYRLALDWITSLCAATGCDPTSVFLCPGNHDVDRHVTKGVLVRTLHAQIKAAGSDAYNGLLIDLLLHPDTNQKLYDALSEYNLFASQYFCDLLPPNRTIARRDLSLNDGSILRLTGFNSAIVSGDDDNAGSLFVDPACFQLIREPGVEHLVMCHHPYHWLVGGADLRDHLESASRIQLFGHEHRQRIERNPHWVRLEAGAAQPDRRELGWQPGYNMIKVEVTANPASREMQLEIHARAWQSAPQQFVAIIDRDTNPVFRHTIPLDPWNSPPPPPMNHHCPPEVSSVDSTDESRTTDPPKSLRETSLRFFKLTFSQKNAIAGKLDLLEEADINQPDFERFRRVFIRAQERGIVDELDREIRDTASHEM